jgi:hypothetical protein
MMSGGDETARMKAEISPGIDNGRTIFRRICQRLPGPFCENTGCDGFNAPHHQQLFDASSYSSIQTLLDL